MRPSEKQESLALAVGSFKDFIQFATQNDAFEAFEKAVMGEE